MRQVSEYMSALNASNLTARIGSLTYSLKHTESAYRRRLYGIVIRLLTLSKEAWLEPGKQARAQRLETRAMHLLRDGLIKTQV